MPTLNEVFGLNRFDNPLSYVVRPLETGFLDSLEDNGVVVLILYGISKQGKTSFIRNALRKIPHVLTQGNKDVTVESVFRAILNKCGISQTSQHQLGGKAEVGIDLGWLKVNAGPSGEIVHEHVAIDIANADSVADVLSKHYKGRVIVIDNFHYFSRSIQIALATAVRSFETYGFKFVLIGTWSEAGYLRNFNPELNATTREFSFVEWQTHEMRTVLDQGLPLLNVDLSKPVKQSIIAKSIGNISLLQELTHLYLKLCGVSQTLPRLTVFDRVDLVTDVGRQIESRVQNEVIGSLQRIANVGSNNPFWNGRPRSWWILQTLLNGTHDEATRGMDVSKLYTTTNSALMRHGGSAMSLDDFMSILKVHWHNEQAKYGAAPTLAYDEESKKVVAVDAYMRFVLRTKEMRSHVQDCLEAA